MIRILAGSALPILGLGAAIALLGPDLVTGPRGEPMLVSAPSGLADAALQPAFFDGEACPQPLVSQDDATASADLGEGTHVVTLGVRYGPDGTTMSIEGGVTHPDADETLVLAFDDEGRIVAVTHPESWMPIPARAENCVDDSVVPAGI